VTARIEAIRERINASVTLGIYAWEGKEPWQCMQKVREDFGYLIDAYKALQRVRVVLFDEWGMASIDDTSFDEDFTDAIHEDGAWRLARDLRAALAPVAHDAETGGAS
jgi:hypothetical protein